MQASLQEVTQLVRRDQALSPLCSGESENVERPHQAQDGTVLYLERLDRQHELWEETCVLEGAQGGCQSICIWGSHPVCHWEASSAGLCGGWICFWN